jgi:hypothetical protein
MQTVLADQPTCPGNGASSIRECVASGLLAVRYPHSSRQPEFAQQLLDGTAVFRLRDGIVVRGVVLDESGQPVSSAEVRVGRIGASWSRETRTDAEGKFIVRGCDAGPGLVTGEADGFAPTAQALTLEPNLPPVQLTLGVGRVLRVRVLDTANRPVAGARVSLDSFLVAKDPCPPLRLSFVGTRT